MVCKSKASGLCPSFIIHWLYDLQMVTVLVNFGCQLEWTTGYPDIWTNIILSVFFGGRVRFTFKFMHWVKQIALPHEGLNKTKSLNLPQVREKLPAQRPLSWGVGPSWALSPLTFVLELFLLVISLWRTLVYKLSKFHV